MPDLTDPVDTLLGPLQARAEKEKTQRAKPKKPRNTNANGEESEESIQRKAAVLFSRIIAPPLELSPEYVTWCSVENRPRSALAGARNKARGVVDNFPDTMIFYNGGTYLIEWKTRTGRVRPGQTKAHVTLHLAGCRVDVARSVEEGVALLDRWGIPHKRVIIA